jgi:methylated-DNA-[protein]-cysteine S-methyltransferase
VEGRRRYFDLTIDWSVIRSQFQRKALQAVLEIPYAQTRTYAQIAAQIGFPLAARAVGRANATNPMPLVIPCHRVVGSDGTLHGYGGVGGLHTKAWLLKMEAAHA